MKIGESLFIVSFGSIFKCLHDYMGHFQEFQLNFEYSFVK